MDGPTYQRGMEIIKKTAQALAWNHRSQLELLNALGWMEERRRNDRRIEEGSGHWSAPHQLQLPR